jgi:transposase
MKQQIFKPYGQNLGMLLPPSLEELIPPNYMVRVVDEIVERKNIEPLIRQYKGGGTSAYHPKMPVKGIVYAYIQLVFLSRKLAEGLQGYSLNFFPYPEL